MALSTYTELFTAVRDELDLPSSVLPDSKITDAITIAESKICRRARFREMEQLSYATYAVGDGSIEQRRIDIPDDLLELIKVWIKPTSQPDTSYREVIYVDPGRISEFYDQSQLRYTLRTHIEFSQAVTSEHRVLIHYLKRWNIASTSTNWLLTDFPDVYFYGALAECEPYIRNDPRMAQWLLLFNQGIDELNELDDRGRDDAELDTKMLAMLAENRGSYDVFTQ